MLEDAQEEADDGEGGGGGGGGAGYDCGDDERRPVAMVSRGLQSLQSGPVRLADPAPARARQREPHRVHVVPRAGHGAVRVLRQEVGAAPTAGSCWCS